MSWDTTCWRWRGTPREEEAALRASVASAAVSMRRGRVHPFAFALRPAAGGNGGRKHGDLSAAALRQRILDSDDCAGGAEAGAGRYGEPGNCADAGHDCRSMDVQHRGDTLGAVSGNGGGPAVLFAWLAYATLNVNYAIFAVFITGYIVFMLSLAQMPGAEIAHRRVLCTALGGAIALSVRLVMIRRIKGLFSDQQSVLSRQA